MKTEFRETPYLGPDGTPYQGGALLANLLLFGRICKALGMDVNPDRMSQAAQSLGWIDLARKSDFYHALRSLIVTRAADLEAFDEAFRLFWRQCPEGRTPMDLRSLGERRHRRKTQYASGDESCDDGSGKSRSSTAPVFVPVYGASEILRRKDFAEMTGEELAMAKEMLRRLGSSLGLRKTRRFAVGGSHSPDLRGSLRKNMRYLGEPFDIPGKKRRLKPRPIVLICDISGSMERYTRLLLHFAHALSGSLSQIESFVFSTRLTRITRPIRLKAVDRALREVGSLVKDWAGGTQTGLALHEFNYRWGRRVLARGALALLITDGWDRGDPAVLAAEMARLKRSCKRLIWLNPLLGSPQYEPLTRGAQAMLPHVDDFRSVRNLASLEALAEELSSIDWNRSRLAPGVDSLKRPRFKEVADARHYRLG